jgi:hypothetical protein
MGLKLCRGVRERYRVASSGGWRWRRREPEGLPHRREHGARSGRRGQPDALPGRLGVGRIKHSLTCGLSRVTCGHARRRAATGFKVQPVRGRTSWKWPRGSVRR